ncbi:MAG TPA: rhomboid family intramembrane serine protease, partial [Stenomitos sp.]
MGFSMPDNDAINKKIQEMMAELDAKSQPGAPVRRSRGGRLRTKGAKLEDRLLWPIGILAIAWLQLIVNQIFFGGRWYWLVYPRALNGIPGIFLSAFSHQGWAHLIGNSIAFCIFSWLILAKSAKDFWITFLIGWIGGGFLCWLLGPQPAHGLSGVVYTLFGYLLWIGWLEKRFLTFLLSLFVCVNFSYLLWGVLPTQAWVAWWGHLFGFGLGIFAAYGLYREPNGARSRKLPS